MSNAQVEEMISSLKITIDATNPEETELLSTLNKIITLLEGKG